MQDFRDYLRAYLAHVRKHGWMKALGFARIWVLWRSMWLQ